MLEIWICGLDSMQEWISGVRLNLHADRQAFARIYHKTPKILREE